MVNWNIKWRAPTLGNDSAYWGDAVQQRQSVWNWIEAGERCAGRANTMKEMDDGGRGWRGRER